MNQMQNGDAYCFLPATKKQEREILFSTGGMGFNNCKIIVFVLGGMAAVCTTYILIGTIVELFNSRGNYRFSFGDFRIISIIVIALSCLAFILSMIAYGYSVIKRLFIMQTGNITYRYFNGVERKPGVFMSQHYVYLDNGMRIRGLIYFCDAPEIGNRSSDKVIAYRIGSSETVYFSFLK